MCWILKALKDDNHPTPSKYISVGLELVHNMGVNICAQRAQALKCFGLHVRWLKKIKEKKENTCNRHGGIVPRTED